MSETLDAPPVIESAPAAPETAAPPTSMRDTMASVLAKYPDRDNGGRFESRAIDPQADDAIAPATPEITDQPETTTAEPATPAIEPPSSWSAEKRAIWSLLPPDAQAYVAQRESEAHKAISEKGQRAAMYDAVEQAIGEHKTALISEYGSVDRAVNTLVNVAMQAGQRPAEFIRWFAQQHRVDLSQLAQPGAQQGGGIDPQIHTLSQTVTTLQHQIEQQQQAALAAQIAAFSEAKDARGQPLRPYFDDVRANMARLMTAGEAASLEDAYDKATRINGDVRAKIEAQREAARQAEATAKAAKAAAEAKKSAAINVRPLGAVAGSPVRGQTMRDTMTAVARQMLGQG
jgi:hypothetical protein